MTDALDMYEMSDEDFAKLNEQYEAQKNGPQEVKEEEGKEPEQEQEERPRDDKGRFVAKEEPEQVDEVVYRREIDLGDGSGKQVFEAASMEELIDKLADAQTHATRKIRELAQSTKAAPKEEKVEPLTEEQRWLLSQELISDPLTTFEKLVEKSFGRKPKDIQEKLARVEQIERAQREDEAAKEWMKNHPEYHATPKNGERFARYFQLYNLDTTNVENIQKAFEDLSQSGLLESKPEEKSTTASATKQGQSEERRIDATPSRTVVVQRRAASGLSAKRSAVAAPEPTTEDLYNMPYDQFLKLGGMDSEF